MTNESKLIKLWAAYQMLTEVRDSFSNKKVVCDCCGAMRQANWVERQTRDTMNAALNRIKNVAERVRFGMDRKNPADSGDDQPSRPDVFKDI